MSDKKDKKDKKEKRGIELDVLSSDNTKGQKEEVDGNVVSETGAVHFQTLDDPKDINDVLTPPNVSSVEEMIDFVNGHESPSGLASVVGTLIEPGKVGVIDHNGKIQLVGAGRWIFPNPRASLKDIVNLTTNPIRHETLTIVRINPGEYGFAYDAGKPIILGEGLHARNTRLFEFREAKNQNNTYLNHGNIHIIRVPRGSYGLIRENNVPKLLAEGNHIAVSNIFNFDGIKNANEPHIAHGTIHILQIPKGKIALVTENNQPKLLYQGTHYINSANFAYGGLKDNMDPVITHGTMTRFRVLKGQIGLAWLNNVPQFFDEGVYEKDDPNFIFVKCEDAATKQINLGSKKIVTVWDGEVGVSFSKGKLIVLTPNRHVIDSVEHVFQGFMSTQQQCLHLYSLDPNKQEKDHLVSETKDFVEIGIKADVFYRIHEAEKVLLVVGKDNVVNLVRDTAVATLNSIIRSTTLAEVAQTKEAAAKSEKKILEQASQQGLPSAPVFFDKVHDEFISKLHDNFMEKYGIEVTNIRIESFKIINQTLAANISSQAIVTTQTQTQLANLASQTEIATAEQKRNADVARIKAEGEAVKLQTETDARNRATMETAKTESDATLIRARAEASSLEVKAKAEANALEIKATAEGAAFAIKAKAEAEALAVRAEAEAKMILKKAEAEAKRAEMLQTTNLGGQLAMFGVYADMVKNSMQGVQKVIYVPSDSATNPLSFFAVNQEGKGPGIYPNMTVPSGKRN